MLFCDEIGSLGAVRGCEEPDRAAGSELETLDAHRALVERALRGEGVP